MEWKEGLHMKEQTGETHLPRWPPNLFQFPDHGRMPRCITPISTYLLRMQDIRAWCPALCSGTEKLTHLPLTSRMCGIDSWRGMASLGDTQICILALHRVLMLESLAYNRLTFPLIVHSLISIPRSMRRLWRQIFRKEDTWVLSRELNSSPLLDLSNPCPSPLLLNLENQGNTAWYTISCTHACHAQIQFNLSIQPSIHRISPAPGELSPQYVPSFTACHQGLKHPFKMSPKLIGPFLSITISGQAWLCDFKVKTALQQTQTTALASPQQVGPMASLLTQEWIFSEQTELAPYLNGSMTTFSFISLADTLKHTTDNTAHGPRLSPKMGDKFTKPATYGIKEILCLMDALRSLTKTWLPPYATSQTHLHALQMMPLSPMPMWTLTFFLKNLVFHGSHPR